jgi:adenylate cyclase
MMDLAIPNTMETEASEIGIAAPHHIQGISDWLISQGLESAGFESILSGFADRLNSLGFQIQRGMIAMRTLHPSVDALDYTWHRGGTIEAENHTPDQLQNESWLQSPLKYMFDTGAMVLRRRLTGLGAEVDLPLFKKLADEGSTDYYMRIIEFDLTGSKDLETGMVSSWTTDRPGGFGDEEIAVLDRLLPRLALTAKVRLTRDIAENVLDTYVGPEAGRRIMRGDIRRGALDVIRAVIVYADLRGFTSISDSVPGDRLAPMLDRYFEAMVPPITKRGGQVLKFIGDGLMATFDLDGRERDSICSDALQSAYEMIAGTAEINAARRAAGLPTMDLDIALHLGDVFYGNVGAADWLDFTVIGPTVNEASRIESLCEPLGHNVLVSETFAGAAVACTGRLIPVGTHQLRGVRHSQALYTIDTSS